MPTVFKNPNLTDYFTSYDDLTIATPTSKINNVIEDYEAGKVITFPNLKLDIDFEFWANLSTDEYPNLKKLLSSPEGGIDTVLNRKLDAAGVPEGLAQDLRNKTRALYDQILPIYESMFKGYQFKRRQAVWRLNTIYNENLHVDTYLDEYPDHFARLFINLDSQPRIWQTGFTAEEMFNLFGDKIDKDLYQNGTRSQIWMQLNKVVFGGLSKVWWDQQPRHVAYFNPGDVWAVDSRQVAHQIFYGRRALSIDFVVDVETMKNPQKHYLNMVEDFRQRALNK